MKKYEILRSHLALLILQYDQDSLLKALSELLNKEPDELGELFTEIKKVGFLSSPKKPIRKTQRVNSLESLLPNNEVKYRAIKDVIARYENRSFLPELQKVKHFIISNGESADMIRSRKAALPKVTKILISLPLSDIEEILKSEQPEEFSSLGLIADQILGKN